MIQGDNRRWLFLILSFLVSNGVMLALLYSPYRVRGAVAADYFLQDRVLAWFPAIEPLEDIVFLGIDEDSLSVYEDDPEVIANSRPLSLMAEPFPWSRELWGLAIDRLIEAGARLVILDLILREPRDGDEAIRDVLSKAGDRVVFGSVIDYPGQMQGVRTSAKITEPSQSLFPEGGKDQVYSGYVNFWTDYDGVVRRVALYTTLEGAMNQPSHPDSRIWPSLSSVVLEKIDAGGAYKNDQRMWQIPMMKTIDRDYPMISLYSIFWPSLWERNYQSGDYFRDKVVMIGPAAATFQDSHTTPVGTMAGPLLHLNAITAAARGTLYSRAGDMANILTMLLINFGLVMVLVRVRLPILTLLTLLLGAVCFLGFWTMVYLKGNLLLSMEGTLISIGLLGSMVLTRDYVSVWRERQVLRQSLDKRVSSQIMREILSSPDGYLNQVGGVRKNVAVLFSDVRGFTSMSENQEPEDLVAQLNEYLDAMVEAILFERGMVDKFIGDAVMAVWGSLPELDEGTCSRLSVEAGHRMRSELRKLNEHWREAGKPELEMGIGINQGVSIVGNIGSEKRMEFTVIGDSVNLAARLESLTKQYGVDFVISESVADELDESWCLRPVDRIRVKGKSRPVTVFEVLGKQGEMEETGEQEVAWSREFADAFSLYQKRQFEEAARAFQLLAKCRPEDVAADKLADRCRSFASDPPPDDWDGSVALDEK